MSGRVEIILSRPVPGAVPAGTWRTERPVVDQSKCTKCGICWLYCPDGVIEITESGAVIDYEYCKGCGICAAECPFKAIRMVREG